MDINPPRFMPELLDLGHLQYLRFERSPFGWSVAAALVKNFIIYHLSSTDGEVTVVAVDDLTNDPEFKEFETIEDAIKFLRSAIDKS